MARSLRLAAGIAWAFVAGAAGAQPLTSVFTYQGEVRHNGVPASGVYDFRFALFDAAAGGSQVGPTLCVDNVSVAEGRIATELDFGAVFTGQQRYLEIQTRLDAGTGCADGSGFSTLAPRQVLSVSPHAAWALSSGTASTAALATNASQLGGQGASFYQNAGNLSSGALPSGRLTGTYSSAVSLTSASNVFVGNGAGLTGLSASNLSGGALPVSVFPLPLNLTASANGAALVRVTNNGLTSEGVVGISGATTGTSNGVRGQSSSTAGRGVYGLASATSGSTHGGYFETPSTSGTGIFAEATATSGSTIGGQFVSRSTEGRAVQGLASAASGVTYGGYFETESFDGVGVFGRANHFSGNSVGGMFEARGTHGVGVFGKATSSSDISMTSLGVKGESAGQFGQGVFGLATHPTGETTGGRFESQSTAGVGVVGLASGLTGETVGVSGLSYSNDGIGVVGTAGTSEGGVPHGGLFSVVSPFGVGVLGRAIYIDVPGVSYGVRGTNESPAGFAVFAVGDMGATGVKPFRIDHPLDPENKYLLHYSAESPEVINFYSGNVVLDESGGATVEMPEYFASINRDPRYVLTPVGLPMPMLHVADEISGEALASGAESATAVGCRFRIGGGVAGGRVSWEVKAVRNDLRMRLHGAPVEREKFGPERGKLQHPGYFGRPREDGMDPPAVSMPRTGGAR